VKPAPLLFTALSKPVSSALNPDQDDGRTCRSPINNFVSVAKPLRLTGSSWPGAGALLITLTVARAEHWRAHPGRREDRKNERSFCIGEQRERIRSPGGIAGRGRPRSPRGGLNFLLRRAPRAEEHQTLRSGHPPRHRLHRAVRLRQIDPAGASFNRMYDLYPGQRADRSIDARQDQHSSTPSSISICCGARVGHGVSQKPTPFPMTIY